MDHYGKLKEIVLNLEEDFVKFYEKRNNAAGTRVRKGMQDLKVFAQQVREDVQSIKNKAEAKKKK